MKKTVYSALAALAVAAIFTGCSKEEAATEVSAALESAESKSLTFTINPSNAYKCSYVLYASDAEVATAEEILLNGTPAHANEASTVTVSGLEPNTEYQFAVAAQGNNGVSLFVDKATTADIPAVQFDADRASGRQYGGATPNFSVTLRTEENGQDYELSLDIYDFVNTTATYLQPGTYTVTDEQAGQTVGTMYSYFYYNNKTNKLVSGKMTVAVNDDKTYTIDVRLKIDDGTDFHGAFTGKIDGLEVK